MKLKILILRSAYIGICTTDLMLRFLAFIKQGKEKYAGNDPSTSNLSLYKSNINYNYRCPNGDNRESGVIPERSRHCKK